MRAAPGEMSCDRSLRLTRVVRRENRCCPALLPHLVCGLDGSVLRGQLSARRSSLNTNHVCLLLRDRLTTT